MPQASYILTPTARRHLREAKAWSLARWGEEQTKQYFHELEKTAIFIAENHSKLAKSKDALELKELGIYPARAHYIVFLVLSDNRIAIVDIIRQGRDVPSLLSKYALAIQRELQKTRVN